jgi:transposase
MLHRHAISDADWDRIKDLLPGRRGQHGGMARDNRRIVDAVLKTGLASRDLP